MKDYAHIQTRTIVMTPREFWSMTIAAVLIAFVAGVTIFGVFAAVVLMPNRDTEAAQRVESAYARGAMIKIAASKARCQQWQLTNRKAVCE